MKLYEATDILETGGKIRKNYWTSNYVILKDGYLYRYGFQIQSGCDYTNPSTWILSKEQYLDLFIPTWECIVEDEWEEIVNNKKTDLDDRPDILTKPRNNNYYKIFIPTVPLSDEIKNLEEGGTINCFDEESQKILVVTKANGRFYKLEPKEDLKENYRFEYIVPEDVYRKLWEELKVKINDQLVASDDCGYPNGYGYDGALFDVLTMVDKLEEGK